MTTFICAPCLFGGSLSFEEMTDVDISGVYATLKKMMSS